MQCPYCHTEIKSGSLKCPNCTGNISYDHVKLGKNFYMWSSIIGAIALPLFDWYGNLGIGFITSFFIGLIGTPIGILMLGQSSGRRE